VKLGDDVNRDRPLTSYREHFGGDGRPVACHALLGKISAVVADEMSTSPANQWSIWDGLVTPTQ
jgi:hypothetical protein